MGNLASRAQIISGIIALILTSGSLECLSQTTHAPWYMCNFEQLWVLDLRLSALICGERVLGFLDLSFSFVFLGVLCGSRPFPIPISVISENQRSDFSGVPD
jgi:hypothetical protein